MRAALYCPGAPSAQTQTVPNSSSLSSLFCSVIYNSVLIANSDLAHLNGKTLNSMSAKLRAHYIFD